MKWEHMHTFIKQLKPGCVFPIYKSIPFKGEVNRYFRLLMERSKNPYHIMLESADSIPRYGERSLGCVNPCLTVEGRGARFSIRALNKLGKRYIRSLQPDLGFCDKLTIQDDSIEGILMPVRHALDENTRLHQPNHTHLLRKICYKFTPTIKPISTYGGLFGAFAYDFIDQFEELPPNKEDWVNDPDYFFMLADHLFFVDHQTDLLHLVANAYLSSEEAVDDTYDQCVMHIHHMEQAYYDSLDMQNESPIPSKPVSKKDRKTDCDKDSYMNMVEQCVERIKQGYAFQIVPSRTQVQPIQKAPWEIYKQLKHVNPSPYMFYMTLEDGYLIGASPEMCIRVSDGELYGEKKVEIRPIAGTKPRGIINGTIDNELDMRYELELRTDFKELAEHAMLIDLARNDVARISIPGTRKVVEPLVVERYSHVQHLVSTVEGTLHPNLDAFHAYLATMNQGTLTGAPKVEAMKILRQMEKTKRGFYGGAVGYFTHHGEVDSTIVIRTLRIKDGLAYGRAGAGVVLDSNPESEFLETERKIAACIQVVEGKQSI
jgi:anthranilate synthase component I